MANITKVTISINEPVEKVWESLMNPQNLQHWLTGFISAEHLTGKVGEVGSTSKLKFRERGKEVEIIETVLAIKPNQQYSFAIKHKAFENNTDIRLISMGHRTELIQTVQMFPKGLFMKLMMSLMKREMKKRTAKELISFKNFVETKS